MALRADKVVERAGSRAEVLFNPNKHRLSYARENARNVEPAQFEALVRDRDENNRPLQDALGDDLWDDMRCWG